MWASYKRDRERVIRPHTLIEKPACIEARVLHDVQNSRSPIPQKTSVKHKGTPRNLQNTTIKLLIQYTHKVSQYIFFISSFQGSKIVDMQKLIAISRSINGKYYCYCFHICG